MKRLLFIFLILGSGADALPKNSFSALMATAGISGLALYVYKVFNPSYSMKKEPIMSAKIDVPKTTRPVYFNGYHTAINANNDNFDYQLSLADINLSKAAQEIGHAYIICTRESAKHPRECNLATLHIDKKFRYQGFGSLLLQEAVTDLQKRVKVDEFNFTVRAQEGISQEHLENFYIKNGAQRKMNSVRINEFVFNVRDHKV